jgi:hypothetical protein
MLSVLRRVLLVAAMALLALAGVAVHANPAAAATANPSETARAKLSLLSHANLTPITHSRPNVYSRSWYIRNPDVIHNYQAMYNLGASDGAAENTCNSYLAHLDFGQMSYGVPTNDGNHTSQYGTYYFDFSHLPSVPFLGDSQITAAVEQYAAGWFHATGTCPSLRIAIGTSNNNECPYGNPCSTYWAGYNWGIMVNNVNSWLSAQHISPQIDAAGADDIETTWDSPSQTFPFLQGFYNASGSHNTFLYDYGDAFVNSVWSDADVYNAAWGYYFDVPLPEIYTYYGAQAWATLYHHHTNMVFYGTLGECASINNGWPGCSNPSGEYSPLNGWSAFETQLGTSVPLESVASNNLCQGTLTPHCY